MNRIGKLLSYTLAFVLCYSQLVASAHFVEHLPQQSYGKDQHAAIHTAPHKLGHSAAPLGHRAAQLGLSAAHLGLSAALKNNRSAKHTSLHANHQDLESRHNAPSATTSPKHGERSIADCSIYHFYSGLSGLVLARANIPCASFDHVITVATRATHFQQAIASHQPIRAPPYFS